MNKGEQFPDLILLCGFMGAGKSTIGKSLAGRLSRPFLDLDDAVQAAAGKPITRIFSEEGEENFRRLEKEILLGLLQEFKGVIALGGGTLQDSSIIKHIKIKGVLIFIETPFSVIFQRLLKSRIRPLLLKKDGLPKEKKILEQELNSLYKDRLPNYRQADITIRTGLEPVVEEITDRLVGKIRDHASDY